MILDVEVTLGRETFSSSPGEVLVVMAVNESTFGSCPELRLGETVNGVDHVGSVPGREMMGVVRGFLAGGPEGSTDEPGETFPAGISLVVEASASCALEIEGAG